MGERDTIDSIQVRISALKAAATGRQQDIE
jgi:hypothetical protein